SEQRRGSFDGLRRQLPELGSELRELGGYELHLLCPQSRRRSPADRPWRPNTILLDAGCAHRRSWWRWLWPRVWHLKRPPDSRIQPFRANRVNQQLRCTNWLNWTRLRWNVALRFDYRQRLGRR